MDHLTKTIAAALDEFAMHVTDGTCHRDDHFYEALDREAARAAAAIRAGRTITTAEELAGAAHTIRGLDAKLFEIRETCEARIIEDADQLADAIIAIIDRKD